MDTDSAYMALSAVSLEEVIKPDLHQVHDIEKKNWFPRNDTPEHAAYDKRTPWFRIKCYIFHTTTRCESSDKHRFSTSGWSQDHTGKWMDPWRIKE
jgi:hypothetical protein